jgi:hypothetical protein
MIALSRHQQTIVVVHGSMKLMLIDRLTTTVVCLPLVTDTFHRAVTDTYRSVAIGPRLRLLCRSLVVP